MSKKGCDRYGNPLPCRRLAEDEEANLIALPGFEHLIGEPQVPTSAGRAELVDAMRPQRARKELPRPLEYRFWGEVREGDRVTLDGGLEGTVEYTGVEAEKVDGSTYIKNYALVRLAESGEIARVNEHARLKRVPEGT